MAGRRLACGDRTVRRRSRTAIRHGDRERWDMASQATVVRVGALHWPTLWAVVNKALTCGPGVWVVRGNATTHTTTGRFDPAPTLVGKLAEWICDCGFRGAGQSVPDHGCDPMQKPAGAGPDHSTIVEHAARPSGATRDHAVHGDLLVEGRAGDHPPGFTAALLRLSAVAARGERQGGSVPRCAGSVVRDPGGRR